MVKIKKKVEIERKKTGRGKARAETSSKRPVETVSEGGTSRGSEIRRDKGLKKIEA